eukprot:TRINITY_DN97058_c0_g1_i1.p1 TRINITY_DN97058_c0_g1~~TRINITY_DN97058_c0_g1_i1.p1  ORF type:complete len:304 (-),score=43.59 TRINITY_DN97058_c0_g1_i1:88-954(-)
MAVTLLDALPWRIAGAVERSLQGTELDNSVKVEKPVDGQRLVLLLGWGGALQKHLSRIQQFYLEENHAVVSYISPMSCFLQGGLIEKDILNVTETMHRELSLVKRRTFHVHIHSNNGTMVWGALMLAFRESFPEVLASLTGIVLDSAPRMEPKTPSLPLQALGFTFPCIPIMLRKNQYVHPVWTPALFVYFLLRLLWMRLRPSAARRFAFEQVRDAVLYGMPADVPQLYLYSLQDKLIWSSAVEDYIARQRKRGVSVSAKVFSDTAHVQHFLRRGEEYKEELRKFLKI